MSPGAVAELSMQITSGAGLQTEKKLQREVYLLLGSIGGAVDLTLQVKEPSECFFPVIYPDKL